MLFSHIWLNICQQPSCLSDNYRMIAAFFQGRSIVHRTVVAQSLGPSLEIPKVAIHLLQFTDDDVVVGKVKVIGSLS